MSMSIPMVWPEVRWESDWGEYRDRNLDGRLIVDGGLLSNFPIELFVSRAKHVTAVMGEETSEHVLGMLIDEATQVPAAPPRPPVAKFAADLEGLQVVQRLQRLMDTVLGAHDKMVMEDLVDRVVRLPAGGYGTTEFDMDEARRAALVEAGRQAMSDYLDTFEARDEGEVSFGIDVGGATPQPVSKHTDTIASNLLAF
jgi:predicted acylesterase/phospholipase RssA